MYIFRRQRLLITLVLLLFLIALAEYQSVQRAVDESPYWTKTAEEARDYGTLIQSASDCPGLLSNGKLYEYHAWYAHTYSYVRTGLFTSKKVVDADFELYIKLKNNDLIKDNRYSTLHLEVDGVRYDLSLSGSGAICRLPVSKCADSHSITLVNGGTPQSSSLVKFHNYTQAEQVVMSQHLRPSHRLLSSRCARRRCGST